MAYVFDPINNTLIDDEDKSLGNKFALNDDEFQKLLDIPGVFRASEAPQPPQRPDVIDIEAINRFVRENPRDDKAEGGRANFADNPLKNFNMGSVADVSELDFNLIKPVEPIAPGGNYRDFYNTLQSVDDINPNLRKNYITETELLERLKLPIKRETFFRQKYDNKGVYNKLINITGKPVIGSTINRGGSRDLLYDITNLNKETINFLKDPQSRRTYDFLGTKGQLVLDNPELKQKFIQKYNEGYGGPDILKQIDPKNKLGIGTPSKYGTIVLTQLLKNNEVQKRVGQSKAHEAYTEAKIKNTDLEIEKIAKIYDKNPSGSLERMAVELAGGPKKYNALSARAKSNLMERAGIRSYNLLEYLQDTRPSYDKNTKYKIKNKEAIKKVLESSQHPIYGIIKEGDIRNTKFAEQDIFFGDKRGTHQQIRKDINNLVNLQADAVGAKNLFVIDEGPGLTTALKNGLPILTRFSNLFNKKTNQAKIELDLKLIQAYPVVTNLDTGKTKYTITASDVEKSKRFNYGLTSKDIGKVINKKDHPAIKAYNKYSKSFSKANKVKTPIFEFGNITDKIDLKNRKKITKEAAVELQKMNKKFGFYMSNMGTDLKLIEQKLIDKPLKRSDFSKKAIVFKKMRDGLQDIYNSIPLKGLRVGPSTAAAVLDYNFFTNVMGVPSAEAALGAANWFTKNKEAARRIGDAIIAVTDGSLTVDEFIKSNGNLLTEIVKASVESTPVSKDDDVMEERLKQMDEVMTVPNLDETTAAPLYDFANGGRAGFSNGGAAGADVDFATELEYFFTNPDAELPVMQTYKETNNPVEILNDIINPRNYPYYADVLARSGLRIGEFGVRVLPAVGKLVADTIQKGPFKVKSTEDNYVRDYLDPPPPSNIKGTGIFSEFLENITPTTLEKKVGLDKLIKKEEQRLKDTGSTVGPKVFADTLGLGAEVTAPIFPGLKLLNSFAKARNLPNDKVTQKILEKEVDKVLSDRGMTRREFLQATGAGATVVMAKMLGLMDVAPKAAKVVRAAPIMDNTVQGMPAWFKDAVYAIERKGILKSRGDIKGIEPDFFEITLDTKLGKKKVLMSKNDRDGEITLDWTTSYYDMDVPVTITYRPGQSGKQNFLSDPEFPQSVEKYDVEVEAPEFEYKTVDVESMGPEDTNFDSAINLDIKEEADAVVEALEDLGLGLTKSQKKQAEENFRYYNEVELDEGSGPGTANPIDESDAYTFLDMIKRNKDK